MKKSNEISPNKVYRNTISHSGVKTQVLFKVLYKTSHGWMIDFGNGYQGEIDEDELKELQLQEL